jgi:hypothetical protein
VRRYLYIPPLFALITTLTSFGFVAAVLATQVGRDSYISLVQVCAVIAICVAAAICSLGLLALVIFELVGRHVVPVVDRVASKAMAIIGLVFCMLAIWSFFLVPTAFYEDFLLKFTHSARFEFLMIGVSALVMLAIRSFVKKSSK